MKRWLPRREMSRSRVKCGRDEGTTETLWARAVCSYENRRRRCVQLCERYDFLCILRVPAPNLEIRVKPRPDLIAGVPQEMLEHCSKPPRPPKTLDEQLVLGRNETFRIDRHLDIIQILGFPSTFFPLSMVCTTATVPAHS